VAGPGWAEKGGGVREGFWVFLKTPFLLTPFPNFKFFTHFFQTLFKIFKQTLKLLKLHTNTHKHHANKKMLHKHLLLLKLFQ
jgi:hypothetical protein